MNRIIVQRIINYRTLRLREEELLFARGTPQELDAKDAYDKAFAIVRNDGPSYRWNKRQSIEIDKHGLEKWIDTELPKIRDFQIRDPKFRRDFKTSKTWSARAQLDEIWENKN